MSLRRRTVLTGLFAASAMAHSATAALPEATALPMLADPVMPSDQLPRWQRYAAYCPHYTGRPAISIVIDDMGVIQPGTQRIVALPAPLTLAWFPFARGLPEQITAAAARGHEALLHMPMQATGSTTAWTGPDPLRIDITPAENLRRLTAALDAVPYTVGLNNHMGSVATRDAALMDIVAHEAWRRKMLVLDSVTIGHSMAYQQAMLAGVPAAARDIFIDHAADAGVIRGQLAQIEALARRQGHAIAIGHPRPLTIEALEYWVPSLIARGFALWPISATVALRNATSLPA